VNRWVVSEYSMLIYVNPFLCTHQHWSLYSLTDSDLPQVDNLGVPPAYMPQTDPLLSLALAFILHTDSEIFHRIDIVETKLMREAYVSYYSPQAWLKCVIICPKG